MQVGAENRRSVIVAAVLATLAVLLFIRMLVLWESPVTATANAPARAAQPQRPARDRGPKPSATAALDPTLRLGLLKGSEEMAYTGRGRNIFHPYEPPVVIPKPVTQKGQDSCVMPHPGCPNYIPPPPPINLKFYGFANNAGEPKKVFLSEDGDIFVAREGDIVNRRYKVLHIGSNSVEIEDVLNNNRQTIQLTQG